jgi:hypothetical protein
VTMTNDNKCAFEDEFERQCELLHGHSGPHEILGYDHYEDDMIVICEECKKETTFKECGEWGYSEIWDNTHVFCSKQCFDDYYSKCYHPSESDYRNLVRYKYPR